jgi:hypothetical protein
LKSRALTLSTTAFPLVVSNLDPIRRRQCLFDPSKQTPSPD